MEKRDYTFNIHVIGLLVTLLVILMVYSCKKEPIQTVETPKVLSQEFTDPAIVGQWLQDSSQNPAGTGYIAPSTDTSVVKFVKIFTASEMVSKGYYSGSVISNQSAAYTMKKDSIISGTGKYFYKVSGDTLLLQLKGSLNVNYWYHKQH